MSAKLWRGLALALIAVMAAGAMLSLLWIGRLFRTAKGPSRLETAIALRLRHLAIPPGERRRRNPLTYDSANLEAGRTAFLLQCASCHGIDGRGHSVLGRRLYPRVPDLLSARTQNLSDGELHFIIEHGVPLSGMPAWRSPRPQTADSLWQLVLYLRSLRPSAPSPEAVRTAAAKYAGSQACARCHAAIYARWRKTPMANVVRDPRQYPRAFAGDLADNAVWKFSPDQVALVYGSLWKQRYFTRIGSDYFALPVQWAIKARRWLPYFVGAGADWWASLYPPDNFQRPTGALCDGCHSVGYDVHTGRVAEWNVGCERCHGPGSLHVARPSADNIFNPARMDYVAANDTCIQCHSQGRPPGNPIGGRYYDWPVGYGVGLRLRDFWKLEDHTLGKTNFYYFADGTAHKNRMQGNDFVQSVMYRRGITCFDCHDVHGTGNYAQLRQPAQRLCLTCHGPGSPNGPRVVTLVEHTHHRDGTPGSRCVDCHMPAIESEGVPGVFVHAHTFRFIAPEMTDKYRIPNPCTSCHKDKSTAWARAALQSWGESSPWRVAN
jgi:predicted CXXCH cytochrome family protein